LTRIRERERMTMRISGIQAEANGERRPDVPSDREVAKTPQKRKLIPNEKPMILERAIRGLEMVIPSPRRVTRNETRGKENFI